MNERNHLKLEVVNTDTDIERHKIDTMPANFACRKCRARWQETLEQLMERNGACPKCGR